ncbi:MAG: hypothetical protein M3437_11440 [Chloroflexota bacterium]|nr:hypothetical protein [Chloroflexota bacterium]MDQ5865678.1 hypothetical protein [Chloroflexota bacterium]
MRSIDAELTVTEKGKGVVTLPPDIEPGEHKVTITINDGPAPGNGKQKPIEFLVLDLGPWPEGLSLRREDMYDDWGR